jgi:hypothetical protein
LWWRNIEAKVPQQVSLLKTPNRGENLALRRRHTVVGMITILSALASLLSFRVRSRASLELEVVALRHQVTVLRRQRPSRLRLFCADRLLWVWLYRIWPQALHDKVLGRRITPILA